jgi:hypothetical protein
MRRSFLPAPLNRRSDIFALAILNTGSLKDLQQQPEQVYQGVAFDVAFAAVDVLMRVKASLAWNLVDGLFDLLNSCLRAIPILTAATPEQRDPHRSV